MNVGSSAAFSKSFSDDEESVPIRGPPAGNTRMLKLFLTDGRQQVFLTSLRLQLQCRLQISTSAALEHAEIFDN